MIKRSKEQWLTLFQQQAASGLSAAEFCKQNNLCDKHFSLRKKQLLSSHSDTAFVPVVVKPKKIKSLPPSGMSTTTRLGQPLQCRFERCVMQFESLPDVVWLSQLIKTLS